MCRDVAYSLGGVWARSSLKNDFLRQVAGAAGLAAIVVVLLAARGHAQTTLVWSGSINNSWDTSTANNWNGPSGPSLYANGYAVVFSNTGTHTSITIAAGGVSPGSVQFTANTTPYTFRVERSPARARPRSAGRAW